MHNNLSLEQILSKIGAQQELRLAKEREKLSLEMAKGQVPLPQDLLEAIITLSPRHFDDIMRNHPGAKVSDLRDSYRVSLSIFRCCFQDLEECVLEFNNLASDKTFNLFAKENEAKLKLRETKFQKETFSFTNAAASLVDHSRRLQKHILLDGFALNLSKYFGSDGLHDFVIGLRILLHHLHVFRSNWQVEDDFKSNTTKSTFLVRRFDLNNAIDQFEGRFSGRQGELLRGYLEKLPEEIDIKGVFHEYLTRAERFHAWLTQELATADISNLRDYDRCVRERKFHGMRVSWSALIGNWVHNWEKPPDPYLHLDKYLSEDQIEMIYKLPKYSREQVDLIIKYADEVGAVDNNLRKIIYKFFEKSRMVEERDSIRII